MFDQREGIFHLLILPWEWADVRMVGGIEAIGALLKIVRVAGGRGRVGAHSDAERSRLTQLMN